MPGAELVTRLGVALDTICEATAAGVAVGLADKAKAATPVTWGEAIEVPDRILVAVALVFQAELMPPPGAYRSTQVPQLENEARKSMLVVAATVIALGSRAGEAVQASALLLPARSEERRVGKECRL